MKEYIAKYYNEKDFDGFTFSFNKKDFNLEITSVRYTDDNIAYEPKDLGFKYHVLVYQENGNGGYINPDLYDAIIGDPISYVDTFIKCNWSGFLCKQSESSAESIRKVYNYIVSKCTFEDVSTV